MKDKDNMKNKKAIILSVIAAIILLSLIIGATYAYKQLVEMVQVQT